jgi:tetratricopeptide (TPR) repeat protein
MPSLKAEIDRLFREADALAKGEDRPGAMSRYRQLLDLEGLEEEEPLAAECAHWGLAELAAQQKDLDLAERHLREAVRLNPDEAGYHQELGVLHSHQSRFGEAAADLEESLRLRPDHPQTVHLLGWALFMSGDRVRGRQLLERAFQLDDCDPDIINDLAVCLSEEGRLDRALALVERALDIEPTSGLLKSFREMLVERRKKKGKKGGGVRTGRPAGRAAGGRLFRA